MVDDIIHISFCTDTNYVMPTGIAMISVCENNVEENIVFHIVLTDEGRTKEEMDAKTMPLRDIALKYKKTCQFYFIDSNKLSDFECKGAEHVSIAAFARIFLPELVSSDISKILYLDCDIVVCGTLKELWHTALAKDCPFAAVVDANGGSASYRYTLQMPPHVKYFNSGVLLMNLEYWREHNLIEKSVKCASEMRFPLLDQDMLNYLFAESVKPLPVRYNFQTLFVFTPEMYWMVDYEYVDEIRSIKQGITKPIMIHYISSNKPWKDEWCPMREVWDSYMQLSPWKSQEVQSVVTRFDRCTVYNDFMDAYWSDPKLMKEILKNCIALQKIAVQMKNKWYFVKIAMIPVKIFASILRFVYGVKTIHKSNIYE